jgi:5-formyltetrahydrofolate cyclo-ligase
MEVANTKAGLRAASKASLCSLFTDDIADHSLAIAHLLADVSAYQQATTIGLYAATAREVQTNAIHQHARKADKKVCYPRIIDKASSQMVFASVDRQESLTTGAFGIPEPEASECVGARPRLDCIMIPGLAFDRKGHRLGRGAGFYDRWLKGYQGVRIGLSFSVQVCADVPVEPWDELIDVVVTEKEIIQCV